MLYHGDCLEVLKTLPDNCIDSLVTDPPAGISFMGKHWDDDKGGRKQWTAWMTEVMSECLRVMKPGAHGLVWAIPRTSHWTGAALEDAGFEVRDTILHCFGSGFPKSMDISKAIDKAAGAKRETYNRAAFGGSFSDDNGTTYGQAISNEPLTDAAKQWEGWGTALKPAAEMWWLIRKPCSEKTVAANVLKWGVGGLNIDGCRIEAGSDLEELNRANKRPGDGASGFMTSKSREFKPASGRFPANLILSHNPDCEDDQCSLGCAVALLDEQSGALKSGGYPPQGHQRKHNGIYGKPNLTGPVKIGSNEGGASRFFYCAKTSTSERNAGLAGMPKRIAGAMAGNQKSNGGRTAGDGVTPVKPVLSRNHHPTVKPQKLMRYLCRLITPPNGIVLDPFMGSGSTGLAAKSEGFKFIGIEKEKEYFDIAEKRIQ